MVDGNCANKRESNRQEHEIKNFGQVKWDLKALYWAVIAGLTLFTLFVIKSG